MIDLEMSKRKYTGIAEKKPEKITKSSKNQVNQIVDNINKICNSKGKVEPVVIKKKKLNI
jgi:hypothetical protein